MTRDGSGPRPLRVAHVITRMIVGGAQENTMLSCARIDGSRFPSRIVCGPETGREGELMSESRARGVPLEVEPSLVRRIDPWKDLVAFLRLTRTLRRGRFDVVHLHSSKAGILGRLAARCAGVPVVVFTVHGWAFSSTQPKPVYWMYVLLERLCAPLTDAIVVVGEPDRAEGRRLGIGRADQFVLIRSGIEIETYCDVAATRAEARARLGIPGTAFVVGSVGRLSPQKAPLDLLAAFAEVARACADAHLVLVGDGSLRSTVEREVGRLGLDDRVHLTGLRRDVPELLRAFDVFALASRWEGLPRVFPQAMAAGLPIVATRVAGAPDAIRDGENGWLVEPGDTAAMTRRLLELAADPARAAAMGRRGRARVEEFSAARMVSRLEELYAELARRRGIEPMPAPASGEERERA